MISAMEPTLVSLVLGGLAFLIALGGLGLSVRDGRRAWRDWESWAALQRQMIEKQAGELWESNVKVQTARLDKQLDDAFEAARRCEGALGNVKMMLKKLEANDPAAAAAPGAGQANGEHPRFLLPQELGLTPEQAGDAQKPLARRGIF